MHSFSILRGNSNFPPDNFPSKYYFTPMNKQYNFNNSSKKPIVPKKGRIRIILIVVVALSFFFFKKADNKPSDTQESAEKDSLVIEETVEKKEAPIKKKSNKKVKISRKLDLEDLRKLAHLEPGIISGDKSTILNGKKEYKVYSSIDTTINRISKNLFKRYHPLYGASVLIHPETGRVLSMVSYTKNGVEPISDKLYLKSIFPAASIFKTVTAVAAIEKSGLTPDSKLKTVGPNHTLYLRQLKENLKDYRLVSFRDSYAYSYNPVFGRIGLFLVGADGLNEFALRFGFNSEPPFILKNETPVFEYPDSSFAIAEVASGFNQSTCISPLFGAMIAGTVTSKGKISVPTVIDSVLDIKDEKVIYRKKHKLWRKPFSASTADKLAELMKAVPRYGTARKSFKFVKKSYRFKDIEYGGKTGSVDKDGLGKIDWFVGYASHKDDPTQRVAVAVVTVHDSNWTIHSSYLGAEIMRHAIRNRQIYLAEQEKIESDTTSTES